MLELIELDKFLTTYGPGTDISGNNNYNNNISETIYFVFAKKKKETI